MILIIALIVAIVAAFMGQWNIMAGFILIAALAQIVQIMRKS